MALCIFQLFLVDDILLFGKQSKQCLNKLFMIVDEFSIDSCLTVNRDKSCIFTAKLVRNADPTVSDVGLKVAVLLDRYLGLPLFFSHKQPALFQQLVDKLRRKFAAPMNQSFGSWMVLIQSVLQDYVYICAASFPLSNEKWLQISNYVYPMTVYPDITDKFSYKNGAISFHKFTNRI